MTGLEGTQRDGRVHRILRNGVALLLAFAVPRLFTLASVIVAARWLGTEAFGVYGAAAALAVIISVVATLGMLPLLVREIARAPTSAARLLGAAHTVKWFSGGLMVLATLWAARLLFGDPQARAAALVLSLGWVMNAFAENLAAYYQAVERMARWTQASALFGIVSAVVGVPLLVVTDDLVLYCWGFVAGWSAAFAWLWLGLPREARGGGIGDARTVRGLVTGLAPFAAAFVGIALYSKMDVLLVERWSGSAEAGVYTAAYKFVDVFQALLVVAAGAVYPQLSRHAGTGDGAPAARYMEVVLLAAVPAGLALHLVASPVVGLVFGVQYGSAAQVLALLALLLPLLGLTIVGGYVMGASGRMGPVAALYLVAVVANFLLNRSLVPAMGAVGAATARLVSEAFLVTGFLIALPIVAGAAPRRRALVLAAACGIGALACRLLPDPTGGWLRGLAFLVVAGSVYVRGRALSPLELLALRRAVGFGSGAGDAQLEGPA